MSLDLKPLHFRNIILKCLSIESVEYCYLIPVVSQLADYWGDVKMVSLCKKMSRQTNQHLHQISDIYFQVSGQEKDSLVLDRNSKIILKRIETRFKNNVGRRYKEEFLAFCLANQKTNFDKQRKSYEFDENFNFLISKKNVLSNLQKIDNSFFQLLEKTNCKRKTHSFDVKFLSDFFYQDKIVDKEVYFFLIQLLKDRKLWKAEEWYPCLSRLLFESPFFLFSPSFLQLSQSEKCLSQTMNIFLAK